MPVLNILCPICTEVFNNADDVYSTSCGHLFHFACMNDWQRRGTSCPQCRQYNPTTHKLYLSFDDAPEDSEELKETRLKLESSKEKTTEALVQKNEAESNFMQLQNQFTLCEQATREFEARVMEMNDFENDFLKLQGQYTESSELVKELEDRVQQLFIDNECKSKELRLKILENESLKANLGADQKSLPDSVLSDKIKSLEQKLKHLYGEFEKEVSTSTQLSIEKIKLESYIKHLESMEKTAKPCLGQNDKKPSFCKNNRNEKREQTFDKNNRRDTDTHNNIFIKELPLEHVTLPLENIIVNLAAKIKLTITPNDLIKVNFVKSSDDNYPKAHLVAEFKSRELKANFLRNKHMLKNNPETKCIIILSDNLDDQLSSLFEYAKTKLRNNGYNFFFCKNNQFFAKKNRNHGKVVHIRDKAHVDKLYDENMRCAKAAAPEKPKNGSNVDENLYKL